jgi:hypothetical protein
MFGNIFEDLQKQQEALQQKLAGILVEAEAGDGAVVVKAGADLHIENIKLDPSKLDLSDAEQLEDLLVVALNRALELARAKAGEETNQLLGNLLPGGMDQMFKP